MCTRSRARARRGGPGALRRRGAARPPAAGAKTPPPIRIRARGAGPPAPCRQRRLNLKSRLGCCMDSRICFSCASVICPPIFPWDTIVMR